MGSPKVLGFISPSSEIFLEFQGFASFPPSPRPPELMSSPTTNPSLVTLTAAVLRAPERGQEAPEMLPTATPGRWHQIPLIPNLPQPNPQGALPFLGSSPRAGALEEQDRGCWGTAGAQLGQCCPPAPQGWRRFLAQELRRCTGALSAPEDVQQLSGAKISPGARDVPGRRVVRAKEDAEHRMWISRGMEAAEPGLRGFKGKAEEPRLGFGSLWLCAAVSGEGTRFCSTTQAWVILLCAAIGVLGTRRCPWLMGMGTMGERAGYKTGIVLFLPSRSCSCSGVSRVDAEVGTDPSVVPHSTHKPL